MSTPDPNTVSAFLADLNHLLNRYDASLIGHYGGDMLLEFGEHERLKQNGIYEEDGIILVTAYNA